MESERTAKKKSDIENKKSRWDVISLREGRKNRRWMEGSVDPVSDTRRERKVAKDGSVEVSAHAGPQPDEPPRGEYVTLQEMAEWLRISRGSAWSLVIEKREIPHLRFGDRIVRLARKDVEAYLARCRSDAV